MKALSPAQVQGLEESTPMEAEATYLPSDLNKARACVSVGPGDESHSAFQNMCKHQGR